jgi:hypothetical protein
MHPPCVLAILALGAVHTVFGVFNVLAFGDLHAFDNIHTIFGLLPILDLSILALLDIAWRGLVIVTSREQQHEHLIVAWELLRSSLAFVCFCCYSLQYDNKE